MGRHHRSHLPGAAHHIVTRTQGHFAWLVEPLRDAIAEIIVTGVASGGARLIAHCVMPNHIHVLLFQGRASLGWVMQSPLRRIAMLLQRYHRLQGHVFERRFRSRVCASQEHLRNSILYIHRNPLEAGLCANAAAYPWSSHSAYITDAGCAHVAVLEGLRTVAATSAGTMAELRAVYAQEFAAYCRSGENSDFAWAYAPRLPRTTQRNAVPQIDAGTPDHQHLIDIHDAVTLLVNTYAPECGITLLRSNFRGREIVRIRRQTIATLLQRGYKCMAIANYFRISPSAVSRVHSAMRWDSYTPDLPA